MGAVKIFMKQLMGSKIFLKPEDFPDAKSRGALQQRLHKTWSDPPICASLCIKVWQMYFELLGRESGHPEAGIQEILRWMPVYSNSATPSALLKALTSHG